MTPEQYLEAERKADFKSEYYDGHVWTMAGATYAHVAIIGNLAGELQRGIGGRNCAVLPNDMRVRVSPTGLYTYPDIVVVCGEPRFADERLDTLTNPTLLVEVLSKSTEAHDRGFKFMQYRAVDSLQEYVLVAQTDPRMERFQRGAGGEWVLRDFKGLDSICPLDSVGCQIALSAVYRNIQMPAEELPDTSARPQGSKR